MRHLHNLTQSFDRRLNFIATGTAILIASGVAAAATAASVGVSASQASAEKKQQKNALADADKKSKELASQAAGAEAAAAQAASDKLLAKKRAITPTILTSPLGVTENEAGSGTTRPTLLGGK